MELPRSQQVRGLLDCDCFYASCEMLHDPQLRGRPVCIGGDIVIARSYEAKPYGIRVGTPMREAKKILPRNAVFLPPRMGLYGRISSGLMSYLQEKCLQVEVFSIDEAFFDITGYAERYHLSYEDIARKMKKDIKKKIGIPVSFGIAPTRLLAKMFADINKPYGECVCLEQEGIDAILQTLPLADVPFIGPQTQSKLSYCCRTAYDFSMLDYGFVKKHLGWSGLKIWFELHSIHAAHYQTNSKPQGISRTRSFNPYFTADKAKVWSLLLDNIDKAVEHLLDVEMRTKHIKLIFRSKSFQRFGAEKRLVVATQDRLEIVRLARELFDQCPFGHMLYRTTGIYLGDLEDATHQQVSLFTSPHQAKNKTELNDIVHMINNKWGRGTVGIGVAKKQKNDFFSFSV